MFLILTWRCCLLVRCFLLFSPAPLFPLTHRENTLLDISLCSRLLLLSLPTHPPPFQGAGWHSSASASALATACLHWGRHLSPGTGGESGGAGVCLSPSSFPSHKCLSCQSGQREQRGLSAFSWFQPGFRHHDCRELEGLGD